MNNVFTFHGSDHKVGVSQICQCLLESIAADHPEMDVLLFHADGGKGEDYSLGVRESIEHIRPYLAERFIDIEELKRKAHWKENMYIIGGGEAPELVMNFHPDMSEYFINAVADSFDVVICDSGAEINFGMALGTLFAAGRVYMVLNQTEGSIRRYEWLSNLYGKLRLNTERYIINEYTDDSAYSREYMQERLALDGERVFSLRRNRHGTEAESARKSLLSYKDERFRREIRRISEDMLCRTSA